MVTRYLAVVCAVALSWLMAGDAAGQAVRSTVLGTVTDRTGGVLPGATVNVTNAETGVVQSTVTDSQGRYSVTNLLPATYKVEASLSGFQTIVREGVRLVVGTQTILDFSLGPSAVQETITVTAAEPVVDTVSSALGTVIEQKQMAELPLIDRSYSKLIVLAPGANEIPASTAGGQFQQFFGRQPQYTVSGARPEGQVFLMDNTNVQNYWNRGSGSGQLGTTLGVEAIAEYQVLTNTYSAQFGGNGVAINAMTVGVNPAIAPLLKLYPAATRQTTAQAAQGIGRVDVTNETPADEDYFVGRFDYTINGSTNLFVRYTGDVASVFEPNSGSAIPLWTSDDKTSNHYLTAEVRRVLTPAIANTVRIGATRTQEKATRTDLDNGLLVFFPGRMSGSVNPGSGVAGIGGNQVLPFEQRQTRAVVGDDVVWVAGGHSLKFGVEYERQTTFVNLPLFGDGAWTFPTLTAFLQNQPLAL